MCTVTFLPLENDGFILTSNRDEQSVREKATPPRKYAVEDQAVFFPKDLRAGGTWIATGVNGYTLCLLNGGHIPHERKPQYRKSRGLVLLDFFKFNQIQRYASDYDFSDIEPFTLVVVNARQTLEIHEFIWDGAQALLNPVDRHKPRVWSSVTLYEKEVIDQRREWFYSWLDSHPDPNLDSVIGFHQNGGNGDKTNNLVMNRSNQLLTVSITSIMKSGDGLFMKYHDLSEKQQYNIRIL